ncbi:hypothetical protein [Microbacterium paludicola]|uniref:hypothetical protein n=1 Tax=Microbacterium paludicola TaxID=300019 RepID=UPI0031D76DDF
MFDGEQSSDDHLPALVSSEGVQSETVRHLGSDSEGWNYYAAKFEREGARHLQCIVVVVSDESDWVSGCGDDRLPEAIAFGTTQIALVGQMSGDDTTGERVGDHLLVTHSK